MTIKTINDFNWKEPQHGYEGSIMMFPIESRERICDGAWIEVDNLKAEAIAWIKELQTEGRIDCEDGCCYKYTGFGITTDSGFHSAENVIEWIKHFFCIKDKDLE